MRFVVFALLVCAFVVPRAAWAEHMGQYGQTLASSEDHVHHGDHVHSGAASDDALGNGSAPDKHGKHAHGYAHNHLAADVLSVGAEPGSAAVLNERLLLAEPQAATLRIIGAPKSPPTNLLRPPRTA